MPFHRPDLITLIERTQADLDSRLAGSPYLRNRLMAILARMQGGLAHGIYGYLDWQALQIMPDTAEAEHLHRWATIWGVTRKTATKADGYVDIPAQAGAVIPEGTEYQRLDGVKYVVTTDTPVKDSTARAHIRAMDAGAAGNAAPGVQLQGTAPILGAEAQGISIAGLSGGADDESDASLRARLLYRIQNQPAGGAARDYVTWALEAPGVTRAWCSPGEMGRGSVTVRFVMDDTYLNGIPTPDDVARVRAHIDGQRPVTADVYVVAPIPHPIDLDLRISPDTPRTRVTTAAAAWATLRREAEPGGVVIVSRLSEAISLAEGEEDHTLLSPAVNTVMPRGRLAVPGNITWGD